MADGTFEQEEVCFMTAGYSRFTCDPHFVVFRAYDELK